jgi:hypothetical protein
VSACARPETTYGGYDRGSSRLRRPGTTRKVRNLQKLMVRHEARVFRMGVKDRHRLIVVVVG